MAYLWEIEDWQNKKLRLPMWEPYEYVSRNKAGVWNFNDGDKLGFNMGDSNHWEIFEEEEPKRYWQWLIRREDEFRIYEYLLDEKATDSTGYTFAEIKLIKKTDKWIDVNSKGEIVACSLESN